MATCGACGDEFATTAILTCGVCEEGYCREHYHDHDCTAPEPEPDESPGPEPTTSAAPSSGRSSGVALGYAAGSLLGVVGAFYFLENVDLVLYGSRGVDALQALVSLGISGAFFSFATFVLVGTFIASQR